MSYKNKLKKIEQFLKIEEKKKRLSLGYFLFRLSGQRAIDYLENHSIGPYPITEEQDNQLNSGISPYKIKLTKEQDEYLRNPKEEK